MTSPADAPDITPAVEASGRFPGWWVVTGSFLILTTTSGLAFYGLAVYLNAFSNEQGWSLSSISLATTLFFVVGGVAGLGVARLLARFDARIVISVGGLIGGAALAILGRVEERWQLYAVYAVFAVGFALAGLVPATTLVTRWFHVRRSVALSVASTGLSVGGVVLTPLAKRLLDEQGLEAGTPWLGLTFALGVVPVAWIFIRNDPAESGWAPDGQVRASDAPVASLTGMALDEAVRSRFFVAVSIAYVLILSSQVGAIQQLVKLVEERTDPETARLAVTVLAATSVFARLAGGRLVQHAPMVTFTMTLAAVQGGAMIFLALVETTALLFVAIVLFGATVGNLLMLQPLLIAERFGVRDYPGIFSRSQFIAMLGTAAGPFLLGWLYDLSGAYRVSYVVAGLLSLAGALVVAAGGRAELETDD
jgi:MFS family permease